MYQKKKQRRLSDRAVWLLLVCLCAGLTGCRDRAEDFLKEANVQEERTENSGQSVKEANFSAQESAFSAQENASSVQESASSVQKDAPPAQDNNSSSEASAESMTESISTVPEKKQIYVDVCGAVNCPGVYALEEGSRVFQAIEAAGGFLSTAAEVYINRAQELKDGQQLYVPTLEETKEQEGVWALPGSGGETKLTDGTESDAKEKVNINTADESRLCTISGIGASKARAIISYREANGPFSSVEEIMNVEGIKEGTFSKIKEEIVVR